MRQIRANYKMVLIGSVFPLARPGRAQAQAACPAGPLPGQCRPDPGPRAPTPCVSLFYANDIGSTGSRGRTVGIPCVYPPP